MCAFVFLHGVSIAEGAAAVRAAVRALPRVNAQVSPQVSSLAEALGAESAAVWSLACVCAQVTPQVSRLRKGFATPVTGVGLSFLLQVQTEAAGLAECLTAPRAAMNKLGDITCYCTVIRSNRQLLLRGFCVLMSFKSLCAHQHRPVCICSGSETQLFYCDTSVCGRCQGV